MIMVKHEDEIRTLEAELRKGYMKRLTRPMQKPSRTEIIRERHQARKRTVFWTRAIAGTILFILAVGLSIGIVESLLS